MTALIACYLYCRRQRRHFIDEDTNTILDPTDTDTNSNTNDDTNRPESSSSSLLSTQYNETKSSNKPKINFGQMFDDRNF
jgi:hypothetical protein